jgi:hypothetical protein
MRVSQVPAGGCMGAAWPCARSRGRELGEGPVRMLSSAAPWSGAACGIQTRAMGCAVRDGAFWRGCTHPAELPPSRGCGGAGRGGGCRARRVQPLSGARAGQDKIDRVENQVWCVGAWCKVGHGEACSGVGPPRRQGVACTRWVGCAPPLWGNAGPAGYLAHSSRMCKALWAGGAARLSQAKAGERRDTTAAERLM